MTQPALIPWPASARFEDSHWLLPPAVGVDAPPRFQSETALLCSDLAAVCGLEARPAVSNPDICLSQTARGGHPESHSIEITPAGVTIEADTPAGIYRATRTLLQWLGSATDRHVICGHVRDSPRCDWRGLMLDVSRHFFTVAEVRSFIDQAALHKYNTFHWHLTDDQGWRFPVAKYPLLTEIGGWRDETLIGHLRHRPLRFDGKRHGGAYTPADIREIVAYAAARHITVLPEIDMPGHMQAAVTAYPELGSGFVPGVRCHWGISQNILHPGETAMRFIRDVLEEVMDAFPAPFIHTGGDEAENHEWGESRAVQRFMHNHRVPDEKALQCWFTREVAGFLRQHGRRMIGWDEVYEMAGQSGAAIPEDVVVMNWRDTRHGVGAANRGHDVILAPMDFTYFNFYQGDPGTEPDAIGGMLPLEKVYAFRPALDGLDGEAPARVLGAQAQLWTEYIPTFENLMYMTWPRAAALAEVLWTPPEQHSWDRFQSHLEQRRSPGK